MSTPNYVGEKEERREGERREKKRRRERKEKVGHCQAFEQSKSDRIVESNQV